VVLQFRILGPLEVVDGERPVQLGGPKQRATLAILLLNANRVISVERLAEDLYAGAPPITAVNQVQRQVHMLRQTLGADAGIETRTPGYAIRLAPDQLDLDQFERLTAQGANVLSRGEAQRAGDLLREALGLWRGPPLADLAYESFAQATTGRLEEIRLATLELRIDADLALGRHAALVPELESLLSDHALRERLQGQLMLALYRSGRQTEALEAYRRVRTALVEGFGMEPSPSLQELQRAILTQDPSLDTTGERMAVAEPGRAVLVLPSGSRRLARLLSVAELLARAPGRELILAWLLEQETELAAAAEALNAARTAAGVPTRTAAFTSTDPSRDAVRLAEEHDVDLVLVDAPAGIDGPVIPPALASLIAHSPADVGVLAGGGLETPGGDGVYLPFGGSEHDWAALEVAAQLARSAALPLRLVGTRADPARGRRDASRLLADAALSAQRLAGIDVEPVLTEAHADALRQAVAGAIVVVAGISPRWRHEGIGASRRVLLEDGGSSVLLVHRGPRPGVLAPRGSRTRFTWSVGG